ncbi:DEAD/DEAH box helicase family protein [Petrotoga sp. 9T1HF07.CasAA.8.2]|uniref:DEAD/DEAH box helicase family protein n=1 Tax=Petrotoga sp. 9T1HF07.CasAA.8.2 TaxID=1434329 RepID=UPI003513E1EE
MNRLETLLQDMIENIRFEDLPVTWNTFDFEGFSESKTLWDYQQNAVRNAIKVLWKYFEDFVDYQNNESLEMNKVRKEKLFNWYKDNGLDSDFDFKLTNKSNYKLLTEYYPQVDDNRISYENFINRMSFWMATGSGKTLVIIKLIQILSELINREEIPPHDILVLTHRDDLIEQLKKHVDEFNRSNENNIYLHELKEYSEIKRNPQLFGTSIFYYRSDNLSDEQKDKIIDFKNYDNDGKWYIFLDEAHKGDKEDSKRQHIYSIMSRNGFLINSSATFIEPRDIVTCAYEFNLSSFINAGYGKHLSILKQEIRAFKNDKEDYNKEEKQKIVLKSLILLTYVKKFYEEITHIQAGLYHKPLLLTLVNSVNIKDADLKLFFRELEKVAIGEIDLEILKVAIDELWEELRKEPHCMFEKGQKVKVEESILKSITKEEILKYVFNSTVHGEIEIIIRQSNNQELAFKLKTSDTPFALIKIGNISEWLKSELLGYEFQERYEGESYFENLNKEESDINILMGSRSFYEGWDSNRPNVINFINIGTDKSAKKFILQSIGRGVRIEPIRNKRKRILQLYNAKEIDQEVFNAIKNKVLPVETLFIFGTNRKALETIIQELEQERKKDGENQLTLFENDKIKKKDLLIPIYKQSKVPILERKEQIKFEISSEDLELLSKLGEFITDDRVFLMRYETEPKKIKFLRGSLKERSNFNIKEKTIKNVDLLVQRFFNYLNLAPKDFQGLKELDEEIKHFKEIRVYLKNIYEIQNKIEKVKNSTKFMKEVEEQYGEIPQEEYLKKVKSISEEEEFESGGQRIKIKYIPNHYYVPLILSEDEKIKYINHIIKVPSEVKFISDLENYLKRENNKFEEFDWWFFSKLDESLDEIYIPYYNPNINKMSKFYPDFIFWLKRRNNYYILFVDPKGTEHSSAYRKIDWYKKLFEENGKEKVFEYNEFNVKIKLLMKPEDPAKVLSEYNKYWFDNIENMLNSLM